MMSSMRSPRSYVPAPAGQSRRREEPLDVLRRSRNHRGLRRRSERGVARRVVAVAVRMSDDERQRAAAVRGRPTATCVGDGRRDVGAFRAGVDEQRAVSSEEQVEERLLEIRAARLAEDEEVLVVFVRLEIGLRAMRSRRPAGRQCPGLDGRRVCRLKRGTCEDGETMTSAINGSTRLRHFGPEVLDRLDEPFLRAGPSAPSAAASARA